MTRPIASPQRKLAVVLALALSGSIPYGWAALWSCALGGGIQVLSLYTLERNLQILGAPAVSAGGLRLLLAFRFLLAVALVGLALTLLGVDPIPFAVGLGTVIPAVLWHGLDVARRQRAEGR